ncbi:MAG: hypothetical protein IK076_03620, partial [Bacteroidales bacterium]|nr:hypothetical protein [Bacteroidales bacterium]
MAYAARFRFQFHSTNGKVITVTISEDGYTGDVTTRPLGGTPSLRLEQNGNIKGMSLEIPAECQVEDEYASLYTSNPYKFLVELAVNGTVTWRGFITPELYSAPWIDPPYDVTITATDGLGELKMHTFPALGRQSLEALFSTLLGATGLNLPIKMISTLENDSIDDVYLFADTTVNLDDMAGQTYYDVLDKLLTSIHATIQQSEREWLLIRETDVTSLTSDNAVLDTSGTAYNIEPFGSMSDNSIWPVGRLRMEIVPAKNSVKVNAANQFPESILADPEMKQGLWLGDGTFYSSDDGFYALDRTNTIYQEFVPDNADSPSDFPDLELKFKARQSGYKKKEDLYIGVEVTGTDMSTGQQTIYYWGRVGSNTSGQTTYEEGWTLGGGIDYNYTFKEVNTAVYGNASDCQEETVAIALSSLRASYLSAISRIRIYFTSTANTIYIHRASVKAVSVIEGVNTRLILNNNARGAASDVEPAFADSYTGNKAIPFMTNSVYVTNAGNLYKVETWKSDIIPLLPYGEFLAKDYALSIATPRLRLQGRLNLPSYDSMPAKFFTTGGLNYIPETWTLDLFNDEMDVSLISLPAASLQVTSVRQTAYGEDGSEGDVSVSVFPASFTLAADDSTTRCYIAITAPESLSWTVTGIPAWVTMSSSDQS